MDRIGFLSDLSSKMHEEERAQGDILSGDSLFEGGSGWELG